MRRCRVGSPEHEPSADDLELVDDSLAGPLCLTCVGCGAAVEAVTDVERLVLELLQRHAHDVETEVHLLASAYHWELDTIEELPDSRRERLARLVAEGRWARRRSAASSPGPSGRRCALAAPST